MKWRIAVTIVALTVLAGCAMQLDAMFRPSSEPAPSAGRISPADEGLPRLWSQKIE